MKRVRVYVRKSDIANGVPCSPYACPVALAMSRVTEGLATVGTEVFDTGLGANLPLPPAVRAFIRAFDAQTPVRPFGFTVSIPE